MPNTMHARLKPYNPTAGHVRKTAKISGQRFVAGEWRDFDLDKRGVQDFLAYLRTEKQDVASQNGIDAFDVCTPAEAREIRNRERYGHLDKPLVAEKKIQPPVAIEADRGMSELNKAEPTHRLDLPVEEVAPPPPPPAAPAPYFAPEPDSDLSPDPPAEEPAPPPMVETPAPAARGKATRKTTASKSKSKSGSKPKTPR
jgi:hypothetical protein